MNIINNGKEKINQWLFSIALKKGITRVATWLASWFVAHNVAFSFQINGITIDNTEKGLTAGFIFAFEVLRNYLKTKYPEKFRWL